MNSTLYTCKTTEYDMAEMGNSSSSGSGNNLYPELIVFDLDYTLWPFHVDSDVDPPFTRKGSKVVDSRGKTVSYFSQVPKVLEYIKSLEIPMAIASRTGEIEGANQLVKLFGWSKYFKYKEIYPGCKVKHFSRFKKATGIPYESMMFFDDEQRNIRDLSKEGVHCVYVEEGVNMNLFKKSLQEFSEKVASKKQTKEEL